MPADAPTPTREEVARLVAAMEATACSDSGCLLSIERPRKGMRTQGGCHCLDGLPLAKRRAVQAGLGALRSALALAPDPWAEADAELHELHAGEEAKDGMVATAALHRRAAQRARGVPVTERVR